MQILKGFWFWKREEERDQISAESKTKKAQQTWLIPILSVSYVRELRGFKDWKLEF